MTSIETIAPPLARALAVRGYETLTPVQNAVLAAEAAERDMLVSAQTGSGKTVAFGMAIAPTLLDGREHFGPPGLPQGLVIAPTRELALQVQRELEWLYADAGARIASCVGGMDIRTERRALERGAHIVVGTPGRLRDHITRGALDIAELRVVVLDEADEMLDLGFREDLEFILDAAPEDRRTLMFSATVPKPIAELAKTFQRDALRINAAGEERQHGDIEYKLMLVAPNERENAVINTLLFYDAQNTIVFCSTREAVKHLTSRLSNRGFHVVALSGELSQAERTNALQSMRDGRARICVATDVAARGIDLPNLDLVVHADLPTNPETLLHRSGRTGRAGRKGTSVLIVPLQRRNAATRILGFAKLQAETISAPSMNDVDQRNHERILSDATLASEPEENEKELVAELLKSRSPEQIALAYLRQQLAARPSAEEITEVPLAPARGKGDRFERVDLGPAERIENGVWFTLSLGRKQRAEPRWILPMICNAGHITKRDVGSIRILDAETQFEVSPAKARAFETAIRNHAGEKGVTFHRIDGPTDPRESRKQGRAGKGEGSPAKRRHAESPAGERPRAKAKRSESSSPGKPAQSKAKKPARRTP